jgi:hypothetical protein
MNTMWYTLLTNTVSARLPYIAFLTNRYPDL